MDEGGSLFIANDPEGQISFPFTEVILISGSTPGIAGAAPLPDMYSAKVDHHKILRRLAGELLVDCLCLSAEDQALALSGASMLARMRMGERADLNPASLTREAAQLFSRLPDKPQHALIVLEILTKFVNYVEDGIIDLSGLEGPGVRRLETGPSPTDPPRTGHLKLVVGD